MQIFWDLVLYCLKQLVEPEQVNLISKNWDRTNHTTLFLKLRGGGGDEEGEFKPPAPCQTCQHVISLYIYSELLFLVNQYVCRDFIAGPVSPYLPGTCVRI